MIKYKDLPLELPEMKNIVLAFHLDLYQYENEEHILIGEKEEIKKNCKEKELIC